MKKAYRHNASPNLSNTAAVRSGQVCSAPGTVVATLPGVAFKPPSLTRYSRREIKRRARVLEAFDALTAKGLSQGQAAKELRTGLSSIWRYRQRIEPLTANCGRKTALEKFDPPAKVLSLVRQLQLAGRSNAQAWRDAGEDPRCPEPLATYLRQCSMRNTAIAKSLLRATRLLRRTVQVIEAPEFLTLIKSNPK